MPVRHAAEECTQDLAVLLYGYHLDSTILDIIEATYYFSPSAPLVQSTEVLMCRDAMWSAHAVSCAVAINMALFLYRKHNRTSN